MIRLLAKKEIARNTPLFQFEKPRGFKFIAGQFGIWTLPQLSPKVEKGNRRYFTIASPPYFEHLEIAMRYTGSPFKEMLKNMRVGDKILLSGPYGNFILPSGGGGGQTSATERRSDPRQIVFLCGGIGVTPARSMILQAFHEKAPFKIYLFYSNNTPQDAAFLDDFLALSGSEPSPKDILKDTLKDGFLFVPTMTGQNLSDQAWSGERGFIDIPMLKRYLPDIKKPLYYVVGPPGFVEAMQKMLAKAGVDKGSIYMERFVGYN